MAEVQWIKLYIDMFDKQKIKKVRRLPAGNDLLLIWIMLLAMAGKCNAGGMIYITESVPYTEDDLADELNFDVNTIRLALKAFEELDMIATTPKGFINVIGWEEHQNVDKLAEIREHTRKRVAKCRENKRLAECNVTSNATSNGCNAIEEEKEEKKEKESHSFIPRVSEDDENSDKESLKLKHLGGTLGGGVVMLSDEQFNDLCEKLSFEELNKYIGIVRDEELAGHHYRKKSHYRAILEMAEHDRKVK